jgi:ribosomal protein S27AE
MIVRIHDLTATCPRCGGIDFEPLTPGPVRLPSELRCTNCGAKTRYLALLDQIGEEAMRRANRAIEDLKKNR